LAAARVTVANGQEELIRSLQTAVTELQQTTDSQMQTIADTERQLHALQLVKSDYDNMVCQSVYSYTCCYGDRVLSDQ